MDSAVWRSDTGVPRAGCHGANVPRTVRLEIDFLQPARGDQEITITSFVREFRGPDALIECSMVDSVGRNLSRCLMTVAHVNKNTNRATDWPPDLMALFFEKEALRADASGAAAAGK